MLEAGRDNGPSKAKKTKISFCHKQGEHAVLACWAINRKSNPWGVIKSMRGRLVHLVPSQK